MHAPCRLPACSSRLALPSPLCVQAPEIFLREVPKLFRPQDHPIPRSAQDSVIIKRKDNFQATYHRCGIRFFFAVHRCICKIRYRRFFGSGFSNWLAFLLASRFRHDRWLQHRVGSGADLAALPVRPHATPDLLRRGERVITTETGLPIRARAASTGSPLLLL